MDGNFRGSTKLPKSVPIVTSKSNSHLIIGKKNKGPQAGSAEFAISSLAVYDRYLSDSDMGGLFGDKSKCMNDLLSFNEEWDALTIELLRLRWYSKD